MIRNQFPFSLDFLRKQVAGISKQEYIGRNKPILGVGLTSRCNFSCPMCYYHSSNGNVVQDMSLDFLRLILNECGPFSSLIFAHQGEPFCYPHIYEALELGSQQTESICLTSNGSLLTNDNIKRLREFPITKFFLSIDGADEKTYSFMRRGGTLNKFIINASKLVNTLGESVYFYAVVCAQNLQSLIYLPELAYKVGVKNIYLGRVRMHPYALQQGISPTSDDDIKSMLIKMENNAQHYGINLGIDDFLGNAELMRWIHQNILHTKDTWKQSACMLPWTYTSILSDGSIFPCCGDFQPEPIIDISFNGIFNHEYLLYLRKILNQERMPLFCKQCRHER